MRGILRARASCCWIVVALAGACTGGGAATSETASSSVSMSETDTGSSSAAGTEGNPATPCEPTTAGLRSAIFEPSCNRTGCHDVGAAGGLDLSADDLEAVLVGVPSGTCVGKVLVAPGDPAGSLLLEKLGDTPSCGAPMPVEDPLAPELVACVEAWIENVASSCETCGTAACVDLSSDPGFCGDCATVCPEGIGCSEGACACPHGLEHCAGECVNTQTSPTHCGACDTACDAGLFCLAGSCSSDCGDLMACDGACVDPMTDPQHCGGCGVRCGAAEACVDGGCGCDGAALSYATDIEPMLVDDCAKMGCHGGMMPAEALDLRVGQGYDELVGVPSDQCGSRMLVAPGEPGSSYLLDKIEGVNLCSGTRMPKSGQGLSTAEVDAIARWICSGADP